MKKRNLIKELKIVILFTGVILSVFFSSCYYDYGVNENNYDLVATFYNKDYNFSNITKYVLIDSVIHFKQEGNVTRTHDAEILSALQTNLNNLGWQRVYDTVQTKIVLAAGVTTSTTTVISGSYPWWGYWGYNWYYPNYVYSYSYTIGTLGVFLTDLSTRSGSELPIHWNAIISGLVGDDVSQSRINSTIGQAFSQSPYLK